jgi:hypothetical protein
MTATIARLIDEGLDLKAARLHAICIVGSHWPVTPYTQQDADWDSHSPEVNRWHE